MCSDFKSWNKTRSKATVPAGENQSNKVANFYRKSYSSKQRVMILEGGFRGWEAHDLPVQQMEATLSQEACDELAVKVGNFPTFTASSSQAFWDRCCAVDRLKSHVAAMIWP